MYCKFCGSLLDDDAAFCSKCGRATNEDSKAISHDEVKSRERPSGKNNNVLSKAIRMLIAAVAIIGVIIFIVTLFSDRTDPEVVDAIEVVQNGYLGEYTDITVKEILDSSILCDESLWDGGFTEDDTIIVQAKYYIEGYEEDAVIIQFTMLNDECFKITAFVDSSNPIDKATDLFAVMNYNYLTAYIGENRQVAGDSIAEAELIDRLNNISGSIVQYGACADYSGNRSDICKLDGQSKLDVSVAMLLDSYGLLDMAYYWDSLSGEEENNLTAQETFPERATEQATSPAIDLYEVIDSESFWETHEWYFDEITGCYLDEVYGVYFEITAGIDEGGNVTYWLNYQATGEMIEVEGEYIENPIYLEIPSREISYTNRSSMIEFTFDGYHPDYSGTFAFELQYGDSGETHYSVLASVYGLLDTSNTSLPVEKLS